MAMTGQSGGRVGKSLEAAVDQARRRRERNATALDQLDQKINELVQRRGDAFMALARHYLPNISTDAVEGVFSEVRDDLLQVLARKQRRLSELHRQSSEAAKRIEQLEAELSGVTRRLDEKVEQREKLVAMVAERLHGSEQFQRLSARALSAEQELERNEQRVEEIKAEAKQKLPSYEKSRLFKYLFDAGFGTAVYEKRGLARRIDRWVARLIDYPTARRGYQFLRVTPELMAQEVERRRNQFNGLMDQVEAIEDRVADEVGLTAAMREGEELGAQRDQCVDKLADQQDAADQLQKETAQIDGPGSEFYAQAAARMKNFLGNLSERRLQSQSQATPEREDDAIVAEVIWLNDQIEGIDREGESLARERQSSDQRLGELQQTLQQFRRAEFDSGRSFFPADFDVDRLLGNYRDGRIDARQMWEEIRKQQQFAPRWPNHRGESLGPSLPTDAFGGDMSHVLFRVLAEVAGQALRESAYRSVRRRAPMRTPRRSTISRPSKPRRGFTNGRGF